MNDLDVYKVYIFIINIQLSNLFIIIHKNEKKVGVELKQYTCELSDSCWVVSFSLVKSSGIAADNQT